jgi:hypothetical protein
MKTFIVAVAFVCAIGAFVARQPASNAGVETLSPLEMMMDSRSLPSESYDTV